MKTTTTTGWREQMAKSISDSKRNASQLPQPNTAQHEARILEDGTVYYPDGHALKTRTVIPLALLVGGNNFSTLHFVPCDERAAAPHALKKPPFVLTVNTYGAAMLGDYARECAANAEALYIRAMNLTTSGRMSKGVRYANPLLTRTPWADFTDDEDLMEALVGYAYRHIPEAFTEAPKPAPRIVRRLRKF